MVIAQACASRVTHDSGGERHCHAFAAAGVQNVTVTLTVSA
jgi:hypothetical protein